MPNGIAQEVSALPFRAAHLRSGDLVFINAKVRGPGSWVKRTLNNRGQRLLAAGRLPLFGWIPAHSHVMLGMTGGLVVHADGKTVSIDVLDDVLADALPCFKVYRRRDLSADAGKAVADAAVRYHFEQYSFLSYLSVAGREPEKADTSQFCSRLVSCSYRASNIKLLALDDYHVLPIDLFMMCQKEPWVDVTEAFCEKLPPPEADEILPPIEVEGKAFRLSESLKNTDKLLRQSAEQQKSSYLLRRKSIMDMMIAEALLAKLRGAQFNLSKQLRILPKIVNAKAAESIVEALQGIETILMIAKLPTLDALVEETILNKISPGDASLYARLPSPSEVRSMQVNRKWVEVASCLLLAEVGLMSIIAHCGRPDAEGKFAIFKEVPREYADKFFACVPPIEDLTSYEDQDSLFHWVEKEADRATLRRGVKNIVQGLKVVRVLKAAASRST